ncbi:hypothetical protein PAMP_008844 [Pampus punctatissimus]
METLIRTLENHEFPVEPLNAGRLSCFQPYASSRPLNDPLSEEVKLAQEARRRKRTNWDGEEEEEEEGRNTEGETNFSPIFQMTVI